MCLECDGWTHQQVIELHKQRIEEFGWSVVAVDADRRSPGFAYTVGLTRYHGHPELIVSGLTPDDAATILSEYGEAVAQGVRFRPGDRLDGDGPDGEQLVHVVSPRRLRQAQEIYASRAGLVSALQVVWSDADGHWPWDREWGLPRRAQPLYGRPLADG